MTERILTRTLTDEQVAGLTPQDKLVYEYFQSGRALTTLVAMVNLGVSSLTARVATLRRLGLDIRDEWAEDHFERRYKKYQLAPVVV